MEMTSHDLPTFPCPACGHVVDQATCVSELGAKPKPGDYSLCINCGEVMVFADDLTHRLPTKAELHRAKTMSKLVIAAKEIKRRGVLHRGTQVN